MCGIVGYVGTRPALPLLLDGLRRLEYRGYDSSGVALVNHRLEVYKAAGRLSRLESALERAECNGSTGVGHTRWATHGVPNDTNAHPHQDCTGRFAVVHNGIIDNFQSLRDELVARGHRFSSDTDTEVVGHLLEERYEGDLAQALYRVTGDLKGSWALACVAQDEPDVLVAARHDSPLVIGVGDGQFAVASDVNALLALTRHVVYLDNGDVARLSPSGVTIWDGEHRPVQRPVREVPWDARSADRGSFAHFMEKEIFEQPDAVRRVLEGRVDPASGRVDLSAEGLSRQRLRSFSRISIVACGTAWHAGLVGRALFESLARTPAEVDVASEFRYRDPLTAPDTLTIAISQSGETADTLAAVREAKRRGSFVVGIVNVEGSTLARESDRILYTRAGPEVAVASTKAYVTQLVTLYLMAAAMAGDGEDLGRLVWPLPARIEQVLAQSPSIRELSAELADQDHLFYIGRGLDYAVAMEGALKLKEISYIHAEAYAAGELKHGTLALIEPGRRVIAVSTQEALRPKMIGNVEEVRARGGRVITVGPGDAAARAQLQESSTAYVALPPAADRVMPVLAVVPLQLLAYHTAVARGCDVDRPRNLAKSVTVE